ncbi:MAG: hypothetical protein GY811_24710 [Myxococcales bacterium]|nr:hypothetical protein [Myxococcales bacterium]
MASSTRRIDDLPSVLGIVGNGILASIRVIEESGFSPAEEQERIMHRRKALVRLYRAAVNRAHDG